MNRNRIIVKMAAAIAETESIKQWFLMDELGTWEIEAGKLLDSTKERAAELGMPAEKVNEEIAIRLVITALQAEIRSFE